MVIKYIIDGYIRGRIDYTGYDEVDEYYFNNHNEFHINTTNRIKYSDFHDEESKVFLRYSFGYDEIGITFSIEEIITNEQNPIQPNILFIKFFDRIVSTYNKFKEHFINNICPNSKVSGFSNNRLVITTYGFFENLSKKEISNNVNKIKKHLLNYSEKVIFLKEKKLLEFPKKKLDSFINPLLNEDLPFIEVILIVDNFYLYVDHHLYAKQLFLEDPSLNINTVLNWGFICSLKLHNIYYELYEYEDSVLNINDELIKIKKQKFKRGISTLKEKIILLESTHYHINDDLKEFLNLAYKIYQGLKVSEYSNNINDIFKDMKSLPHSLSRAYAILEIYRLGGYSNLYKELYEIKTELNIIELNYTKSEFLYSIIGVIVLYVLISMLNIDLSYISNLLQVLTFVIALLLLVISFWK